MRQPQTAPKPVIVIGAGPVGLYAAFQLGMRGMRPVLIDALPRPGGQCAALYPDREIFDAPGFAVVSAADLARRLAAQVAPFDPLYLFGRRAMSVWGDLAGGFNVETDTGETITGAGVIFAGGAGALRPRRITAEGLDGLSRQSFGYAAEAAPDAGRIAIVGAGPGAVEAALSLASHRHETVLIHETTLNAAPGRLDDLHEEARKGRLKLVSGAIDRVEAADGRLTAVEIAAGKARTRLDLDYLLVQAGLELIEGGLTGLEAVADARSGETLKPGLFIIGDAVRGQGRPPVVAAGFSEAIRAAEAMGAGVAPDAPRALPHTASSPALRARLGAA